MGKNNFNEFFLPKSDDGKRENWIFFGGTENK